MFYDNTCEIKIKNDNKKMVNLIKFRKGALEMDQLGKLLIGLIVLIILIVIVTVVIGGEFGSQGKGIADAFNIFK